MGWIVIIGCWIFLYFWGVTSLVDGLIEWFANDLSARAVHVAFSLTTTVVGYVTGWKTVYSHCVVFRRPS